MSESSKNGITWYLLRPRAFRSLQVKSRDSGRDCTGSSEVADTPNSTKNEEYCEGTCGIGMGILSLEAGLNASGVAETGLGERAAIRRFVCAPVWL